MKTKSTLLSVLILLSLLSLLASCSKDDTVIDEIEDKQKEEEQQTPKTFAAQVTDNKADMPPGGGVITVEFSEFTNGCDVSRMVDKDPNTKFETPHSSFYVTWSCNKDSQVNQYSLTSSADGSYASDPKSWTLSGSNDNENWTKLDEQSNQIFALRGEVKVYPLKNEDKFKHYKLEIKSNNGGATTQIAEWAMCIYSFTNEEGTLTPQYSLYAPDSGIDKLMDDDPETFYSTPFKSFYIQWEVKSPVFQNHYYITSAKDDPESDPKSWVLHGSVNKYYWVKLDEQVDQEFTSRGETKGYPFENDDTRYKYFKLEIKDNNGADDTQIAEWKLDVVYSGIEDLMKYSTGSSYSSVTPMGNWYAREEVLQNARNASEEDFAWLLNPANEPPVPGSVSHLYYREFPVNLYPYGKPLPADVNQHAIGNCGGVAALASMAYIYPNFVKSLIIDNGNNTYTVKMFDPQGEPVKVTVSNQFLTGNGRNIDAVSGKNNTATWATVLEKAIMKWNVIYKANPDIGGIGSEHVPPLFTGDGNSFAFSPGSITGRELARVASVCLEKGMFMVGGFNKGDLPVDKSKTVTSHAYTIMLSADPNALFAMRNPWGGNPDVDGTADGVLNIPSDITITRTIDFRITYPGIAAEFGQDDPVTPYIPPTLNSAEAKMRVASYLLNPQPIKQ